MKSPHQKINHVQSDTASRDRNQQVSSSTVLCQYTNNTKRTHVVLVVKFLPENRGFRSMEWEGEEGIDRWEGGMVVEEREG